MKQSIISLLIAGLCAGGLTAALAQNVTADPKAGEPSTAAPQKEMTNPNQDNAMRDKAASAFLKADKDKDGTLDKKEAMGMPGISKNFAAIDTDHDGTVSLEEVNTYLAAHPGKKGDM